MWNVELEFDFNVPLLEYPSHVTGLEFLKPVEALGFCLNYYIRSPSSWALSSQDNPSLAVGKLGTKLQSFLIQSRFDWRVNEKLRLHFIHSESVRSHYLRGVIYESNHRTLCYPPKCQYIRYWNSYWCPRFAPSLRKTFPLRLWCSIFTEAYICHSNLRCRFCCCVATVSIPCLQGAFFDSVIALEL